MKRIKTAFAMAGVALALAACDPVATGTTVSNAPPPGLNTRAAVQMNEVFQQFTPLQFKAMRTSEMRQRLKAGGYVKASTRTMSDGRTQELWRGVVKRGGKNVSRARVRFTTCPRSSIIGHSRTTLDDARKELTIIDRREKQGNRSLRYLLISAPVARGTAKRGQLTDGLGGIRIFNDGARRMGITMRAACR